MKFIMTDWSGFCDNFTCKSGMDEHLLCILGTVVLQEDILINLQPAQPDVKKKKEYCDLGYAGRQYFVEYFPYCKYLIRSNFWKRPFLHTLNRHVCWQILSNRYLLPVQTLELFLNRAELSLNSANSGNLKITEAWTGLHLKILSLEKTSHSSLLPTLKCNRLKFNHKGKSTVPKEMLLKLQIITRCAHMKMISFGSSFPRRGGGTNPKGGCANLLEFSLNCVKFIWLIEIILKWLLVVWNWNFIHVTSGEITVHSLTLAN